MERPSLSMPRHDRLVGYSLYFFNYSTWEGRVLYMEDLYIRKEFRSELLRTAVLVRGRRGEGYVLDCLFALQVWALVQG